MAKKSKALNRLLFKQETTFGTAPAGFGMVTKVLKRVGLRGLKPIKAQRRITVEFGMPCPCCNKQIHGQLSIPLP